MNQQARFITIEGIEGVGKSTLVQFMAAYLKEQQIDFTLTREPGGTDIAEKIRHIFLSANEKEKILPNTELLLLFASRAQHIAQVILPALQKNQWVICDRFVDASYAYQGGGRGIQESIIQQLDRWIVDGLIPQLTILLDAPPEVGFERVKNRQHDRIEQEKIDFFNRVRTVYLQRAKAAPDRFRVIDATQPVVEVQQQCKNHLDQLIKGH